MIQPAVLYILYATSYLEQTGEIITFAQFEEEILLKNERNLVEYKPFFGQSYAEDNSDKKTL